MTSSVPRLSFFAMLGCAVLAVSAGYAAIVLHSATWADTQQLNNVFPFYHWKIRTFTPVELRQATQWLAIAAGALGTSWAVLFRSRAKRTEQPSQQDKIGFSGTITILLNDLTQAQRRGATAAFAALTGLRLVLSLPMIIPAYDDAASYTLFVSKGLLAVSSYYPLPNNHVLSNTLSWLFFQVNPSFWWTMRLPVVLTATAATGLLFVGLLREKVAFRPALLATVLFSLSQLSLYHAVVGRGYWLLTGLAGLVFFSTMALSRPTARTRRAWWGLVVGGMLGTYAVPTFALVLGSAFSWLGLECLRRRDAAGLLRLGLAGGITAVGSLLLYAPLLFISGPAKLFNNGFVASLPLHDFLAGLPRFVWQTEGAMAGQVAYGGLLVFAGFIAAAGLLWRARQQALPAQLAVPIRRLGLPALWFIALPYAVLAAQRVLPPGRTMFYKAFFFFTLLALVLEWLLQTQLASRLRLLRPLLGLLALGWAGYQVVSLRRDARIPLQHNAAYHEAFAWLARQTPGPVLAPEPTHAIFLGLYFRAEQPAWPWHADAAPQPGIPYAYAVAFPNRRGYFQPRFAYPPAFHNQEVDIYRISTPTDSTASPAYWHLVE
ncbi:hypothetical protein [Hymenobacter negativus]|uniref:Glycosyltransferase RgtA/B/C/D-like domain-containing protein n=1 Tax=Hymenobacter negativus TaxID=2795026 RepID=A0ABS3QPF9_9BACT|nr:hypothetical protein [Hymenobacter negativus]MBO2012550.1 hypothetical protein [Hymenobacter negativus]